jgi:hypothetical protein
MTGFDLCIPRNETAWPCYFQNRFIMFCLPIFTFMYLCAIYVYSQDYSAHINRSQIHECRNWKRGGTVWFLGIHKSDFRYTVHLKKESLWTSLRILVLRPSVPYLGAPSQPYFCLAGLTVRFSLCCCSNSESNLEVVWFDTSPWLGGRGSQRDVVFLGWTKSALVYEPKCRGGGERLRGLSQSRCTHGVLINFGDPTSYLTCSMPVG